MGYQLNADALNTVFAKWSDTYDIYAPKLFAGTGRSSMQDIVRYGKITKPEEIVWDKRSDYSAKDVLLPVCQTLFYFNENTVTEAEAPEKGAIILLRSCDLHAIKRFDYMYLQNGPEETITTNASATASNSSSWAAARNLKTASAFPWAPIPVITTMSP